MNLHKTNLEPAEERFLRRQLRNESIYLYFSIVGVVVAFSMLGYYLMAGLMDGVHFALIMIILIGARGNLKQHKDARLLAKFHETEKLNAELLSSELQGSELQKSEI